MSGYAAGPTDATTRDRTNLAAEILEGSGAWRIHRYRPDRSRWISIEMANDSVRFS